MDPEIAISAIMFSASNLNPSIKRIKVTRPVIRKFAGNPSRYNTMKKAKNTRADPASGCKSIISIGAMNRAIEIACVFICFNDIEYEPKYAANARLVKTFANSEGCSEKEAILYHDLAPFISAPNTRTPRRSTIPKAYKG